MKPTIGRIVIVKTDQHFNGSDEHPAIINRVWGANDPADARGSHVCINVTVLPDCAPPFCLTSVCLFETREEAAGSGAYQPCWWPERPA